MPASPRIPNARSRTASHTSTPFLWVVSCMRNFSKARFAASCGLPPSRFSRWTRISAEVFASAAWIAAAMRTRSISVRKRCGWELLATKEILCRLGGDALFRELEHVPLVGEGDPRQRLVDREPAGLDRLVVVIGGVAGEAAQQE